MLAGYLALLVAIAAGVITAIFALFNATWASLVLIFILLASFGLFLLRPKTTAQLQQDAWINRKLHPGLWQMVDEVAQVAETRSPDEIRLGPEMRATLSEQGGFRSLVVGLPLLGGLSTSELRAVTGHELAHFETVSPLEARLPRVVLFPYRLITKSQSRARAEHAEEVAVAAAGEEVAKAALMKLPALASVWHDFRLSSARVSYQYRTPDLVQRFNAFLSTPQGTEALAKAGVAEWAEHGGPAWELLSEPDKSLPYLQRQLFEELGVARDEKTV
ncbi:M48 family metallopeptidase [Kibdelosporangium philippinense]|uniref:M48 family metallopeptidase n=1 Tax=Kibdelosporangium philippinense TaxID=211113 RepID=A0ABS8ZY81_9PSEU|nr:M48 family metallopeptidase [Kibdelosporangium philippinense]MCE7011583.1 M48 family metallopeptidase [Kibdelosporangium philippinense]